MMKRIGLMVTAIFALLLVIAPHPIEAQTLGTNWTGYFYPTTDFTGASASASYPSGLNFLWSGIPTQSDGSTPVTGFVLSDNFSVRFTSVQGFTSAGTYQFTGYVDDAMTVYVNESNVYTQATPGSFSFQVPIPATGSYSMRVDFIEYTSVAQLQFQWQLVSGSGTTTGTPTATVPLLPEGPIGQVVNVSGLSLRTGPYLGASFIGVLRPGIAYPVLAQNADEGGGYTWYKVVNGVQVGWASGRFLLVLNGTPPTESTGFEQLSNPASTSIIATPNAYVFLRRRPSVRSATINDMQIPWGGDVEVLGRTVQGGQNFWLLVRYNGVVGWVYAPYFHVTRGSINQAPIY